MENKKFLSERLFLLRSKKKLSQKALGELLGVSDAAITMMEKGKRSPSFEILCALADYFEVSIDYLTGRTDKPEINR